MGFQLLDHRPPTADLDRAVIRLDHEARSAPVLRDRGGIGRESVGHQQVADGALDGPLGARLEVDIRYCIRDVAPLLADGATVRVRVTGTDLETGAERTIEGVVSDLLVTDGLSADSASVAEYGGQAGLVVETDDGPIEVGGWGAMVEELEAHSITLLSVT